MRWTNIWKIGVAAVSVALAAQSAEAAIYNIDATSQTGTAVSLDAGQQYLIEWIGTADDPAALYDAAGNVKLCPACATGFSNAIVAIDDGEPGAEVFTTNSVYGTAADSLAAYKSGNNINDLEVDPNPVLGQPPIVTPQGFLPNPWIVNAEGGSAHLLVADAGDRSDNTGGISLRITHLGAVPEPATWAMMLGGFGLVGWQMRRRGHAVTA